jgi:hypothetical protein
MAVGEHKEKEWFMMRRLNIGVEGGNHEFFYPRGRTLYWKKPEKVVFWGGEEANEIAAPHFGPRFFSTTIKGGARVKLKKVPQSFSDQLRLFAALCGILWHFAANCGKLAIICGDW